MKTHTAISGQTANLKAVARALEESVGAHGAERAAMTRRAIDSPSGAVHTAAFGAAGTSVKRAGVVDDRLIIAVRVVKRRLCRGVDPCETAVEESMREVAAQTYFFPSDTTS